VNTIISTQYLSLIVQPLFQIWHVDIVEIISSAVVIVSQGVNDVGHEVDEGVQSLLIRSAAIVVEVVVVKFVVVVIPAAAVVPATVVVPAFVVTSFVVSSLRH